MLLLTVQTKLHDVTNWQSGTTKHIGEMGFDYRNRPGPYRRDGDDLVQQAPSFTRLELEASIARTKALSHASPLVLQALSAGVSPMLASLFDDTTNELAITYNIQQLADHGRSSFAGDLGAGFADILMRRLGFVWLANGREWALRRSGSSSKSVPDFAYWSGAEYSTAGIGCLVEAKGTTMDHAASRGSASIIPTSIRKLARDAYAKQVQPFTGQNSSWLGCAVAFGTSAKSKRSYAHAVLSNGSQRRRGPWPFDDWPFSPFPFGPPLRWLLSEDGMPFERYLRGGRVEVPALLALLAFRSMLSLAGYGGYAKRIARLIDEQYPMPATRTGFLKTGTKAKDTGDTRPIEDDTSALPSDEPRAYFEIAGYRFTRRARGERPSRFGIREEVLDDFMRQLEEDERRQYFLLNFYRPRIEHEGDRHAVLFSDGMVYLSGV